MLPILFREEVLSIELIKSCSTAIDYRNKIVHDGENIELETAKEYVRSLKQCSKILMEYTI